MAEAKTRKRRGSTDLIQQLTGAIKGAVSEGDFETARTALTQLGNVLDMYEQFSPLGNGNQANNPQTMTDGK
jgi:soluble cytochrome b562